MHFNNIYGHQTFQGRDSGYGNANYQGMRPFDCVVTWRKKKLYLRFCNTYDHQADKVVTSHLAKLYPEDALKMSTKDVRSFSGRSIWSICKAKERLGTYLQ